MAFWLLSGGNWSKLGESTAVAWWDGITLRALLVKGAAAMGSADNQYRKPRMEKAAKLRELGIDPFGKRFEAEPQTIAEARALVPDFDPEDAESQERGQQVVTCCWSYWQHP